MIEVRDAKDFHRLATRIGKLDNEVKKEMRKQLVKVTKPVIVEVKTAALSLPSGRGKVSIRVKNGQRASLRASIAKSVGSKATTTRKGAGLHIRVNAKKFEAVSGRASRGKRYSLPWYVDGRVKRGWKHPVFGANMDKPETWPIQKPTPFLGVTVRKSAGRIRDEVNEVFTEALDKVGIHFK